MKECPVCGAQFVPKMPWHTAEEANQETNLVSLCRPCHTRKRAVNAWEPSETQYARIRQLYLTQARVESCACGGSIYLPSGRWDLLPFVVATHQAARRHRDWTSQQEWVSSSVPAPASVAGDL